MLQNNGQKMLTVQLECSFRNLDIWKMLSIGLNDGTIPSKIILYKKYNVGFPIFISIFSFHSLHIIVPVLQDSKNIILTFLFYFPGLIVDLYFLMCFQRLDFLSDDVRERRMPSQEEGLHSPENPSRRPTKKTRSPVYQICRQTSIIVVFICVVDPVGSGIFPWIRIRNYLFRIQQE